jgi:hypothetical protein
MSGFPVSAKRKGRVLRGWLALCVALGISSIAAAVVPESVSFQGIALDPDGSPIDGSRDVLIRIYDQPSAGIQLFAERHVATPFLDGVFQLSLGTGSPLGGDFPLLWSSDSRWLEVEIAGEVLSPRTRFQSVPYALSALNAQTCETAKSLGGIEPGELIREVRPGEGLGSNATGGTVTLFADFTQTQRRIGGICPVGSSIRQINADGSVVCEVDSGGNGDITSVQPGAGLVGGGGSGDVSLAVGTNMITSAMVQNGAIASVDIATGAVGSAQIADFSVGTNDVAFGSLTALHVAPESLSSGNVFNEAGGDFSSGNQSLALTSADVVVRSVVIEAPSDGIAIVFASGYADFTDPFSHDGARCAITTGTAIDFNHLIYATEGAVGDQNSVPFSATRGYEVLRGTNTFNLVCDEVSGQVALDDSSLTAIFLPTRY